MNFCLIEGSGAKIWKIYYDVCVSPEMLTVVHFNMSVFTILQI